MTKYGSTNLGRLTAAEKKEFFRSRDRRRRQEQGQYKGGFRLDTKHEAPPAPLILSSGRVIDRADRIARLGVDL